MGVVGIEIATLTTKSFKRNGVAPPPCSNWSLLEPNLLWHPATMNCRNDTVARPAISQGAGIPRLGPWLLAMRRQYSVALPRAYSTGFLPGK